MAQRDGAQFLGELHDVGKLVEVSGGVGAGGQHKDERDGGRRLLEDRRQVRGLEGRKRREMESRRRRVVEGKRESKEEEGGEDEEEKR